MPVSALINSQQKKPPEEQLRSNGGEKKGRWRTANGRITDKKALEAAETIAEYCKQQRGCQNCLLRAYGADHWKCLIEAYDIRYALENKAAKQKNHGYI